MLCKIKEAVKAEKEHRHALTELEESIQESDLGVASLTTWKSEVVAWELDHSNPNPFESRIAGDFFFVFSQVHGLIRFQP